MFGWNKPDASRPPTPEPDDDLPVPPSLVGVPGLVWHHSLEQMCGGTGPSFGDEPYDARGLPDRWERAFHTRACRLDEDKLGVLLRQSPSPEQLALLIPIAVERYALDDDVEGVYLPHLVAHLAIIDAVPGLRARASDVVSARSAADSDRHDLANVLVICDRDPIALERLRNAGLDELRATQDDDLLLSVLAHRLARASTPAEKVALHLENARDLWRTEWAELQLMNARELEPRSEIVLAELERLHLETRANRELIDLLVQRAGYREERGEHEAAREDLVRAADLAATQLDDHQRVAEIAARLDAVGSGG